MIIILICSCSLPATHLSNMTWTFETSLALRWFFSLFSSIWNIYAERARISWKTFYLLLGSEKCWAQPEHASQVQFTVHIYNFILEIIFLKIIINHLPQDDNHFDCNPRFVWGALAEDNGNHLDPGDRGILRWSKMIFFLHRFECFLFQLDLK